MVEQTIDDPPVGGHVDDGRDQEIDDGPWTMDDGQEQKHKD